MVLKDGASGEEREVGTAGRCHRGTVIGKNKSDSILDLFLLL